MIESYWVSCLWATAGVEVDISTQKIVETAPIWKKFVGQSFGNLIRWLERSGKVDVVKLSDL